MPLWFSTSLGCISGPSCSQLMICVKFFYWHSDTHFQRPKLKNSAIIFFRFRWCRTHIFFLLLILWRRFFSWNSNEMAGKRLMKGVDPGFRGVLEVMIMCVNPLRSGYSPLKRALEALGVLMLSRAIWALYFSILIQNGILESIVDQDFVFVWGCLPYHLLDLLLDL